MNKLIIIGVGPGAPDLLPLRSRHFLEEAEVVAGFTTVLKPVQQWLRPTATQINLTYKDQTEGLNEAARQAGQGQKVVVCAWGDFNFSGKELVERVRLAAQPYDLAIELVPGISSLQIACTRSGLAMEESLFITLHRRGGLDNARTDLLQAVNRAERHLLVLPHTFDLMPPALAAFLLENGQNPQRPITVYERLTHPDEREHHTTLGALAESKHEFSDLSIVVLPLPVGQAEDLKS